MVAKCIKKRKPAKYYLTIKPNNLHKKHKSSTKYIKNESSLLKRLTYFLDKKV